MQQQTRKGLLHNPPFLLRQLPWTDPHKNCQRESLCTTSKGGVCLSGEENEATWQNEHFAFVDGENRQMSTILVLDRDICSTSFLFQMVVGIKTRNLKHFISHFYMDLCCITSPETICGFVWGYTPELFEVQGFSHWVTRGRFWADVKNSTIGLNVKFWSRCRKTRLRVTNMKTACGWSMKRVEPSDFCGIDFKLGRWIICRGSWKNSDQRSNLSPWYTDVCDEQQQTHRGSPANQVVMGARNSQLLGASAQRPETNHSGDAMTAIPVKETFVSVVFCARTFAQLTTICVGAVLSWACVLAWNTNDAIFFNWYHLPVFGSLVVGEFVWFHGTKASVECPWNGIPHWNPTIQFLGRWVFGGPCGGWCCYKSPFCAQITQVLAKTRPQESFSVLGNQLFLKTQWARTNIQEGKKKGQIIWLELNQLTHQARSVVSVPIPRSRIWRNKFTRGNCPAFLKYTLAELADHFPWELIFAQHSCCHPSWFESPLTSPALVSDKFIVAKGKF